MSPGLFLSKQTRKLDFFSISLSLPVSAECFNEPPPLSDILMSSIWIFKCCVQETRANAVKLFTAVSYQFL